MKYFFTLLFLAGGLCSCMSKGSVAKMSVSPSYHKGAPLKVLVLPLETEGNPDLQTHNGYSDRLSIALMEIGMTPIDRTAVLSQASTLGIQLDSLVQPAKMKSLASALHANAVLVGTVHYNYIPETKSTVLPSVQTSSSKKGGTAISIDAGGSSSTGSFFVENSLSVRLIDPVTAETLLTGYVEQKDIEGYLNSSPNYGMVDEMTMALKKKLGD